MECYSTFVTCSCCRILLCQLLVHAVGFSCVSLLVVLAGPDFCDWRRATTAVLVLPRKWTQFGFHSWLYVRRMRVVEYRTCLYKSACDTCGCVSVFAAGFTEQSTKGKQWPSSQHQHCSCCVCPKADQSGGPQIIVSHCQYVEFVWVHGLVRVDFTDFRLRKGLHMRRNFEMCTYL